MLVYYANERSEDNYLDRDIFFRYLISFLKFQFFFFEIRMQTQFSSSKSVTVTKKMFDFLFRLGILVFRFQVSSQKNT